MTLSKTSQLLDVNQPSATHLFARRDSGGENIPTNVIPCPAGSSPSSAHASIDGRADGMFGSAPPTPHREAVVVHQQTDPAAFRQEPPVVQQQLPVRALRTARQKY